LFKIRKVIQTWIVQGRKGKFFCKFFKKGLILRPVCSKQNPNEIQRHVLEIFQLHLSLNTRCIIKTILNCGTFLRM